MIVIIIVFEIIINIFFIIYSRKLIKKMGKSISLPEKPSLFHQTIKPSKSSSKSKELQKILNDFEISNANPSKCALLTPFCGQFEEKVIIFFFFTNLI